MDDRQGQRADPARGGRDQATLAAAYDREWAGGRTAQPYAAFWRFAGSARDHADAALGPVDGRRVLELAPGDGLTAIRRARSGAAVAAVDISLGGLRALAGRAAREDPAVAGRIAPLRGDVERLPLADASVDLIAGENFLMYVDPAALGRECRRVLRQGGRIVLIEPTAHHPLVRLYRRFGSPYRGTAPRYFALDDLARLAAPFAVASHREFYLLGVLALPLAARPAAFARTFRLLNALDRVLFRLCPPLRRFGWLTVVTLA